MSSEAAQQLAFEQLNELKEGARGGHQGLVLPRLSSSIKPIRTVLEERNKRRSKRYYDELSSDDSTADNNNDTMSRQTQMLTYVNQIMKAQLRQYRTKHRKIERLCCVAIYRDDYLSEVAGVALECGDLTNISKSKVMQRMMVSATV